MGVKRTSKSAAKALKAGRQPPVAVVVSRYNATVTDRLLDGAVAEYIARGGRVGSDTGLGGPDSVAGAAGGEGRTEVAGTGGDAAARGDLVIVDAPGSYELVALSLAAAKTGEFAGVVALGCIIKGETIHDRVIADAIATGLLEITLRTGVPVALGVITAENPEQALARATPVDGRVAARAVIGEIGESGVHVGESKGNKGREAMAALLDTVSVMAGLAAGGSQRVKAVRGGGGVGAVSDGSSVKPDKARSNADSRTKGSEKANGVPKSGHGFGVPSWGGGSAGKSKQKEDE